MTDTTQSLDISDIATEVVSVPRAEDTAGLSEFAEEVQPAQPTVTERLSTAAQGATGEFMENAPIVSGAIAGGKIGAAVGALGGPFAPVTVPLGAALGALGGGVAGYYFGKELREQVATVESPITGEPLIFNSIEEVPLNLRPYAVAGETFGGSAAFATAPYAIVRNGIVFAPNLAGRIINRITGSAAAYPLQFALSEASMALSASTAAGVMEHQFPGQPLPRLAGEVFGGMANPWKWARAGLTVTFKTAHNFARSLTPGGRLDSASEIVKQVLVDAGEDPAAIIAALRARQNEIQGLNLTSGTITGSPTLRQLEATLAKESARFGEESRQMSEDSLAAIRQMIDLVSASGHPGALRAAAQMRDDYFTLLMSNRLHVAEQRVLEAAAEINPGDITSQADFGRRAATIMQDALADVRAVERELWGHIDRKLPSAADGIIARYEAIRGERLPEESLPAIVEGFVRRMRGEADDLPDDVRQLIDETFGAGVAGDAELPTTTGELILFRSRMLDLAREAAAKNEFSDAKIYGELAEAALDDLDVAMVDDVSMEAYDVARKFSRQLHDTFSRTFAGETLETTSTGARRIPPELVMARAFATGREMGELQFRQLEEAARMAGVEHVSRLLDVQERTIRAAAGKIVDPATQHVNPDQLARFRRDNAELLGRFPEIDRQLADTESAERLFRNMRHTTSNAQRAINNQAIFARLIKNEDPVVVIGQALRGAKPQSDFAQLVKLARRGGPEAMDGLETALFRYAFERAGGQRNFSFARYREIMETPLRTGGPSIKQLMLQNGVTDQQQFDLLTRYLDRADEITRALNGEIPLEGILSRGDAMIDFMLRIGGSATALAAPTGGAHPLIVGQAGSRFFRQVFDKIPQSRVRDVLIEAAKNPEFMAALLERPISPKARVTLALQMNAYLWNAGIFAAENMEEFVP